MHIPVLQKEVLSYSQLPGGVSTYLDCTFGRGGHFKLIQNQYPKMHSDAIDQDLEAIAFARAEFSSLIDQDSLRIHHCNFMQMDTWPIQNFRNKKFDLILADLGVSSPQLDHPNRGFSFYHDGPLDMRMNQDQETTAATIINESTEEELIEVFKEYGELYSPYRAVKKIIEQRQIKNIESTMELAELIVKADGWRKKHSHPATKYFLALRLKVNDELSPLDSALDQLIDLLEINGRLLVISFHSSEDRIVKWNFKKNKALGAILTKKVIAPSKEEVLENPRARSAKLRVFQKGGNHE